jgi:hypothetical protein
MRPLTFVSVVLLIACGSHEAPPPHQEARSSTPTRDEDAAPQIASVKAVRDGHDGSPSSPNITPAMREQLGHGLPPDSIRQVVVGHQATLRRCYDVELARLPDLKGTITMTWMIAPDGSVSNASVAASTIQNTNVETCVLAEVKAWTFPTADAPTHIAAYPLKFGVH